MESILASKTIPAQLKNLQGLKNAYVDIRGNSYKNVLSNTYAEFHIADIAQQATDQTSQILTNNNAEHLINIAGKNFQLNVLDSNNIFGIGQAAACKLTQKAINQTSNIDTFIKYQAVPLHGKLSFIRLFATLIASPLLSVNALFKLSYKSFGYFLQYGKDKRLEKLARQSNSSHQQQIKLFNQQQVSIQNPYVQVYLCQNGKDRTGVQTLINAITNSAANIENLAYKDFSKDYIGQQIVNTGHVEALAGHYGATLGIAELKSRSVFDGVSMHSIKNFFDQLVDSQLSEHNYFKINAKTELNFGVCEMRSAPKSYGQGYGLFQNFSNKFLYITDLKLRANLHKEFDRTKGRSQGESKKHV
jgi:hypothetical protein